MTTPIEPSSDIRQLASAWRQLYIALTNEGFTPTESLGLLGIFITANANPKSNK
jgi:hypothetical protein